MTNALATTESTSLVNYNPDQIDLIKRTICQGSTNDEFELFLYQCKKTGLDALARQIYAVKRWDSNAQREVMAIQTSIDGFRLIAERSGKYSGQLGPFWCGDDGVWRDVWVHATPPAAAKIGVMRPDFSEPCWGVARFDAYAGKKRDGGLTHMWAKMSDVMIAKCAESLALRKAFPLELSGLYTSDEMPQDIQEGKGQEQEQGQAKTTTKSGWNGPLNKTVLKNQIDDICARINECTEKDSLTRIKQIMIDDQDAIKQARLDSKELYDSVNGAAKRAKERIIDANGFPGDATDDNPFGLPPVNQ